MLRRTPLPSPRAHRRDIRRIPHLLRPVRPRRQLDKRVQRHIHPRALRLVLLHVIRIHTPQHRLMRDDEDILRPLQLHDDGFEPDHHVAVGLAAAVAIVVFVGVSRGEVLRVAVLDVLVGETVADAGVELVEGLPLELIVGCGEEAGGGDRAFEGGGPNGERAVILGDLVRGGPG